MREVRERKMFVFKSRAVGVALPEVGLVVFVSSLDVLPVLLIR